MPAQVRGGGQRIADLVERQTGMRPQQPHDPRVMTAQLAPPRIALPLGVKRSGLPLQLDHVVDEFRRNPEMPRRRAVAVAFIDKGNHARPQLNRM